MKDFLKEYAKQITIGVSLAIASTIIGYYCQKKNENDSLQRTPVDLEKIRFKTSYNKRFNFSIEIPENWDRTVSPFNNDGFVYCIPLDNICVTASGIRRPDDSDEDEIEVSEVLSKEDKNIKILSSNKSEWEQIIKDQKNEKVNEVIAIPGYRVIYEYNDEDNNGERRVAIELFTKSDIFQYAVICSCPQNKFPIYKELMLKIANSLKVYNSDEDNWIFYGPMNF